MTEKEIHEAPVESVDKGELQRLTRVIKEGNAGQVDLVIHEEASKYCRIDLYDRYQQTVINEFRFRSRVAADMALKYVKDMLKPEEPHGGS